jgi:hypothetical protein
MKVLQVQSIVPDLLYGIPRMELLAYLVLDDEAHGTDDNDGIDPTTHPGDVEFEGDIPFQAQ